ncbi:MAG: hypothetical protein KIT27_09435 [Legionellales bacterium]|nr:hypothetical protein [Legionellales bacterium]
MANEECAKQLLAWNEANLNAQANWQPQDLANFFAEEFIVRANGRRYEANYQTYAEFLNTMRSSLQSIRYTYHEFIVNKDSVVIPLIAKLTRLDNSSEQYEAMLMLKFNPTGNIVLWHEVYTPLESHSD